MDWHLVAQAAACTQQTYCGNQRPNLTVGDATLLYEYGDGYFQQRANIFKSKSLGMVVSFEGTNGSSFFSSVHDIDYFLVDPLDVLTGVFAPGVKVLHGFYDAYVQVARPILQHLEHLMEVHNEKRITVTGHSLGAGMAMLAAAQYERHFKQGIHHAFTFGQPRAGNPAFANDFDRMLKGRFFYTVNGRDWVPHYAIREVGYQHASGQIWIYPAQSGNWTFYPGQENVHGANSVDPIYNNKDHDGYYYHTAVGANILESCPPVVAAHA